MQTRCSSPVHERRDGKEVPRFIRFQAFLPMVRRSSVVAALVRSESTESDLQESVQVSADSEKTLPPSTDFLDRIVGTIDPEGRKHIDRLIPGRSPDTSSERGCARLRQAGK